MYMCTISVLTVQNVVFFEGGGFLHLRARTRNTRAKLKSDVIFESAIKFDIYADNMLIC